MVVTECRHNIVLASQPLLIEISSTETRQLRVRNNLQRKNKHIISHSVGLSNIAAKYKILARTDILIKDQDGHFTVLLPLLN